MRTITSSCDRAMSVLANAGYSPARELRLVTAHDEGCCYLCHVPYSQTLDGCPCPHWLIMPWASVERVEQVLEEYELAGIIHFVLGYAKASHGSRRPYRAISATRAPGELQVLIKTKRRHWAFTLLTEAGAAPRLRFSMKTRSTKDFSSARTPSQADVEFFYRLTEQVDLPESIWTGLEVPTAA